MFIGLDPTTPHNSGSPSDFMVGHITGAMPPNDCGLWSRLTGNPVWHYLSGRMRSPRQAPLGPLCALLLTLSGAGCGGVQQGSYTPCDEPAGLALGCEAPAGNDDLSAWDACMKLATCGVIVLQDDPQDPAPDTPDPFSACVDQIQRAERDLGSPVTVCIANTACPDLLQTLDDSDDPNSQNANIEGVIGWCGRLDPQ